MIPFPSLNAPLISKDSKMARPWNSYFSQFTQSPAPVISVVVGISPYSFVGREPGNLIILGGTVTAVHLLRGTIDIDLTGNSIIPVSINDIVIVTYTVLPTLQFLPSLGSSPQ